MPYGIKTSGSRHVVFNKATGRVLGRHPTRESAIKQIEAVNISEHQGEKGVPPVRK